MLSGLRPSRSLDSDWLPGYPATCDNSVPAYCEDSDENNQSDCEATDHCEWHSDEAKCEDEVHDEHDHSEEEEHHGIVIHITGVSVGSTSFKLELMHGNHVDYTSIINVPIFVTASN